MTKTTTERAGERTHKDGCMGNYDYRDCTCAATDDGRTAMVISVANGVIYDMSKKPNDILEVLDAEAADSIARSNGMPYAEQFVKAHDGRTLRLGVGLKIIPCQRCYQEPCQCGTIRDPEPDFYGFVIKGYDKRIHLRSTIDARYREINRPAKNQPLRGLAVCVEGTGRYRKDQLFITASSNVTAVAQANQESVKKTIRRVRSEEGDRIIRINMAIEETRQVIEALHEQKKELTKLAFDRGHTVYLNEVKASAEAKLVRKAAQ